MKYYVKCNHINNKQEVELQDVEGNTIYVIKKQKLKNLRAIEVRTPLDEKVYEVNFYPLKFVGRYQVLDKNNNLVVKISTGLHLLHKVEIGEQKYVCKANLFKIRYMMYEKADVIGRLKIVKQQHERYFEIALEDNVDIIHAVTLYLIAQAQRINCIRK